MIGISAKESKAFYKKKEILVASIFPFLFPTNLQYLQKFDVFSEHLVSKTSPDKHGKCHINLIGTMYFYFLSLIKLCNKIFLNNFQNQPVFLRVCSASLSKTLGGEEIARNEQFLLFPQCFLSFFSNKL